MNQTYLNSTKNTVLSLKPSKAIRLLLMVLFVCLFGNVASAQTQTFTIIVNPTTGQVTNTFTWQCPAGVTSIDVKAWGAGAGGELTYGGGGGGAYAGNKAVQVTPGASYRIIVGRGGGVGAAGGNSSVEISSTVLVKAEGGGKTTNINGGSALNSKGSPGLVWSGGNGIKGDLNNSGNGGGGGGSAGAGGDGGTGSAAGIAGAGGAGTEGTAGTSGAAGGNGGTTGSRAGSPGSFPGGGGGEKFYNNGNNASSGRGGNGQVIISWCSPIKTVASTTTWSGGSWSNGYPTNIKDLVFDNNYSSTTDIEGCSCQVNATFNVDIESGKTLKLTNELIVNGRILFKDKSSLVQINNVANTGNIEYERNIYSSYVLESDYIYWSSPVAGFKLGDVYKKNTSGLFYSYGVTAGIEDWIQESSENTMTAGKGYIINGITYEFPLPPPSSPNFKGVPNNGDIIVSVQTTPAVEGTSALLGNPYPSAIDADKFLSANATILDGTLYFWTHNTERGIGVSNPGTGVFAYSSDDYASYNITGGVATTPDITASAPSDPNYPVLPVNPDLGKKPSGKIAAGQGFFATSIKSGNVTFTNDMRVSGGGVLGNNSQFFKTKDLKGKTANTFEKNRIWLNFTNTQGAFKQTLIGYITDATNDYDNLFDGQSFDANEFVDFYSVYEDKNLVIQGRALPFEETDEVQLGFRTTIDGNFTINIDEVDGLMTDQAVFIEDKLTNTVFNLKTGNYTFSTAPGTFNDRFVLRYTNKTLGTENYDSPAKKVLVSNANKQIKINSFAEMIDKVVIYDLLGRQVFQKANVNNNELSIVNLISSHQVLVVKTLLQNGNTFTDKIIY